MSARGIPCLGPNGATHDDVVKCQDHRPQRTGAKSSKNGVIDLMGQKGMLLADLYNTIITAGGPSAVSGSITLTV